MSSRVHFCLNGVGPSAKSRNGQKIFEFPASRSERHWRGMDFNQLYKWNIRPVFIEESLGSSRTPLEETEGWRSGRQKTRANAACRGA